MFDPQLNTKQVHPAAFARNWEADIDSVEIEHCNEQDDPLGYRVVFHQRGEAALRAAARSYVIGASFLRQRLENLKKSGFEAPMTLRAIRMIEKRAGCCLLGSL